jgi:putative heme-binding domain-containing protein
MPAAEDVMTEREVRQTAAYVRSLGRIETTPVPGDPALGSAVYRGKGNCSSCHGVRGDGGVAGPDLAGIGDRRSSAYLLRSLLEPEADLPDGYLLVALTPRSGARVSGVRVNEDSFSIQLRDDSGTPHSFWKSDVMKIDKMRAKSAMPSYKNQLSQSELTDLVAYLVSLKEDK